MNVGLRLRTVFLGYHVVSGRSLAESGPSERLDLQHEDAPDWQRFTADALPNLDYN